MPAVKSLEDLKRIRDEALKKRNASKMTGRAQIIVGMGTSGIAVGARQTMKAVLKAIDTNNLSDVLVTQTGGLGLDAKEPIVQVQIADNPKVTYANVTPAKVEIIFSEHIIGGKIVDECVFRN
jgi:NADP-reducing hydrogenase subunit HndB